ncbi:MAG: dTMP kinase [Mycobacteriales bacterium]
MTKLRPFSSRQRGLFISVDGPSGAGKSTIVHHLAQMLVAEGEEVHVTAEPSTGAIGQLARDLTESITGHALACLYAADRYHHLDTEIDPHLDAGQIVITDRYVASSLVMQRFDGINPAFLVASVLVEKRRPSGGDAGPRTRRARPRSPTSLREGPGLCVGGVAGVDLQLGAVRGG